MSLSRENEPLLGNAGANQSKSSVLRGIGIGASAIGAASLVFAGCLWGPEYLFGTPILSTAVTEANLVKHLEDFSSIAASKEQFENSRSVINGYNASVDYIVDQLKTQTDYLVTVQPFTIRYFENTAPPKLSITSDRKAPVLLASKDFDTFSNSGSGEVISKPVIPLHSGCLSSDFKAFPKGVIALLSREADPATDPSGCTYKTKISNAVAAGAAAVLVYTTLPSEGPTGGRVSEDSSKTPVIGVSHPVAIDLLERSAISGLYGKPLTMSLATYTHFRQVRTLNVIADTPAGNASNIIVAGSHLDSVPHGPGINDDGSGASATLETAIQLYRLGLSKKVVNKVRFAWWSAEELGLLGSTFYVNDLAQNNIDELHRIALNLNNDMIASPNGVRFIYNGREAQAPIDPNLRGPCGKIQSVFENYYDSLKIPHAPTEFDGRSDYGEFLKYGIPAGGLFAGAEKIKTEKEAIVHGGLPGVAYDPCYHKSCDTLRNIQGLGIDIFVDLAAGVAHAVQTFAFMEDLRGFLSSQ